MAIRRRSWALVLLGVLLWSDPGMGKAPASMISAADLKQTLGRFVGDRSPFTAPKHHDATTALIASSFRASGWKVGEQTFEVNGVKGTNVIARKAGTAHPERVWILGAHYDTVDHSPGADDNGVAVAGVLEVARVLSGRSFRDTVELVAWDLEESGLHGSRYMAQTAQANAVKIQGALVLEMIGCRKTTRNSQSFPPGMEFLFPDLVKWVASRSMAGDFISVIDGKPGSMSGALKSAAHESGLPLVTVAVSGAASLIPDFYRSDHASFWDAGYPAVMITDTADFRNEHYHSPQDGMDTVDFGFAADVMKVVTSALATLAGGND